MDSSNSDSVKKLRKEIHSNAQKLETIARDLRRIMKSLDDAIITSPTLSHASPSCHPTMKDKRKDSYHESETPVPTQTLDYPSNSNLPPETKKILDSIRQLSSLPHVTAVNDAFSNAPSSSPVAEHIKYDSSSDDELVLTGRQRLASSRTQRDSGVSIETEDDSPLKGELHHDNDRSLNRDTTSLLSLKDKPYHSDFYAWNPPARPGSPSLKREDHDPTPVPLSTRMNLYDPPANEDFKLSFKDALIATLNKHREFKPAMTAELNFISLFLAEMNKINRYVRKHYPETLVYSSKPRRVYDFMCAVSRTRPASASQVESLKREAPIFWDVFGSTLQNAQLTATDFQIDNPIIREGVPITREHFIQFIQLLRDRRNMYLKH